MTATPRLLALLSITLVAGCGSDSGSSTRGTTSAPDALAELVPADAIAIVYAPSLDGLGEALEGIASLGEGGVPFPTDPLEILSLVRFPGDTSQIDTSRPFAVALRNPAMPVPAFLVPVKDAAAFEKSVASGDVTTSSGYALVGAKPGKGASSLVADLPAGQLALRIDVEALAPMLQPLVGMGLAAAAQETEPMAGFDPDAVFDLVGQAASGFFEAARVLDVAADYEGGALDVDVALQIDPESALASWAGKGATGIAELAGSVDSDAAMSVYMGVDTRVLTEKLTPLVMAMFEMYPESLRDTMQQMFDRFAPLYATMGSCFAGSQDFGDEGMSYTYLFKPDDPKAAVAELVSAFREGGLEALGYEFGEPETIEIGSTEVMRLTVEIHPEVLLELVGGEGSEELADAFQETFDAMLGQDMALSLAVQGDYVAMTMGSDHERLAAALERAAKGGKATPAMAALMDAHGDANPVMLVGVDFAQLMGPMMGALTGAGSNPTEGLSAPMSFYAAMRSNEVRFGASIDLVGMAAVTEALMPR